MIYALPFVVATFVVLLVLLKIFVYPHKTDDQPSNRVIIICIAVSVLLIVFYAVVGIKILPR